MPSPFRNLNMLVNNHPIPLIVTGLFVVCGVGTGLGVWSGSGGGEGNPGAAPAPPPATAEAVVGAQPNKTTAPPTPPPKKIAELGKVVGGAEVYNAKGELCGTVRREGGVKLTPNIAGRAKLHEIAGKLMLGPLVLGNTVESLPFKTCPKETYTDQIEGKFVS